MEPFPPSIKALAHWLSVGEELVFGQESILSGCCLPKESQLFFPPTWLLYWLSRGKQPDPTFGHVRMLSPTDAAEAVQSLRESLVPWHWSLKGALKGHHEEAIPQFEGQRLHLQTHSPWWSWWGLCCLLCPCPPGGWGRPALQGFRALFIVTTKNLVRISFLDCGTAYLWSWWTSWDQAVLQKFWNLDLACPHCIILVYGVSKLWCQQAARHSSRQKSGLLCFPGRGECLKQLLCRLSKSLWVWVFLGDC